MRQFIPRYCRPEAMNLLSACLDRVETLEGLVHGAVALARHEMPRADPVAVLGQMRRLADTIRARVRSGQVTALMAHAHEVLFDEEGFGGITADCHNPRNSYLPAVLETHRGLPILLVLIYKGVLEMVGVHVHGINAPAHFLAGVETQPGRPPTIIDPFFGGRLLSHAEALEQIESLTGAPGLDGALGVATHRQWLARMTCNLEVVFARDDRYADMSAMIELRAVLQQG